MGQFLKNVFNWNSHCLVNCTCTSFIKIEPNDCYTYWKKELIFMIGLGTSLDRIEVYHTDCHCKQCQFILNGKGANLCRYSCKYLGMFSLALPCLLHHLPSPAHLITKAITYTAIISNTIDYLTWLNWPQLPNSLCFFSLLNIDLLDFCFFGCNDKRQDE